ncbi:unnamed protein product, partial [Trichobilharzia regenti]
MEGEHADFDDDHDRDEGFPDEDTPFHSDNAFSDDGRYQDDGRYPDDRYPDDSPVHKHDDRYQGGGPRQMRMMRGNFMRPGMGHHRGPAYDGYGPPPMGMQRGYPPRFSPQYPGRYQGVNDDQMDEQMDDSHPPNDMNYSGHGGDMQMHPNNFSNMQHMRMRGPPPPFMSNNKSMPPDHQQPSAVPPPGSASSGPQNYSGNAPPFNNNQGPHYGGPQSTFGGPPGPQYSGSQNAPPFSGQPFN